MKPLQKKDFGKTSKGELATVYTLENEAGMQISVSDFGATLTSVLVPDKDNNPVEVTLGYDDAAGYEAGLGNAFGASVGRNANRIGGAVIEINGTEYHLTKNDGENNLHSGLDFYHGRMWKVADADDTHVTFEMDSPDGDQGYPGALVMKVTYSLDEENTLMIHYEAEPDQDTIINMTNHSYFNLNGHKSGDVLNHTLWLNADAFTPADAASIPTGEIRSVEGTPIDFRTDKIGRAHV